MSFSAFDETTKYCKVGRKLVMASVRRTLTVDQKNVIVQLYKQNVKQTEIAKLFSVNRSTVYGVILRYGMNFVVALKTKHALVVQNCSRC